MTATVKDKPTLKAKNVTPKFEALARRAAEAEAAALAKTEKEDREPVVKAPVVKKPKAVIEVVAPVANNGPVSEPAVKLASELQAAFNHFNKELFGNSLPPTMLRVETLSKYKGYFKTNCWSDHSGKLAPENVTHEIVMDPVLFRERKLIDTLSTLAHEMAHAKDKADGTSPKRSYHGKSWVVIMKAIGLTPVICDAKGNVINKETGPNSTHTIDKGGKFETVAKALISEGYTLTWLGVPPPAKPEKEKKKKAGGKFKYEAQCGTAFWGKSGIKSTCQCGCDSAFEQIDKPDEDEADAD